MFSISVLSLPFLLAPAVLADTFTNYFAGDSECVSLSFYISVPSTCGSGFD